MTEDNASPSGQASPARPAGLTRQSRPWAPVALFVGVLILGAAGNYADGFNEDELQHLHAAWLVGNCQVPYRDYFDHHPPLYHFLFAPLAAGFGTHYASLLAVCRSLALAVAAGTALLFARLFPRTTGRGFALSAGALLVVSRPSDILFYFRPDSMAMLLVLAATLFAIGRRQPIGSFAAGVSLGVAFFFTQKVAALVPAFGLWEVIPALRGGAARNEALARTSALLAGLALPVAAMLLALDRLGALQGFYAGPIGFGSHWRQPDGWQKFAQEPLLLGFGAVVLGLAWSVRSVAAWARRGDERWSVDALLGMLALFGLAGYLRTPAPTPQAYFMTVHVWLLAGALRLVLADGDPEKAVGKAPLTVAAVGGLLLLYPRNAAAAACLWAVVYLVWRFARGRKPLSHVPALAALGVVALIVFTATQADRLRRQTVRKQLASLRAIDRLIPAGGQALTTWPILTPARPHATYHWFSDIGMYTSIPRETLRDEYLAALASPRTAVAVCDPDVIRRMLPAVWERLQQDFVDGGLPDNGLRGGRVFVRKSVKPEP